MAKRSGRAVAITAVTALVLGAGIGWGLHEVLRPPVDLPDAPQYLTVPASRGSVSRSMWSNTTAQWATSPAGFNRASGVITRVPTTDFQEIAPGTALYYVSQQPVVVAKGAVPAYRDLTPEAKGPDVAQLETFLTEAGYTGFDVDERYTASTAQAVKQWQKSLGMEQTGTVRQQDIVFLSELPVRGRVAETIRPGASLSGGEQPLELIAGAPQFTMQVQEQHSAVLGPDTVLKVESEDVVWDARVVDITEKDEQTVARLEAPDGGPVCGQECDKLPTGQVMNLRTELVVVPETEGITVPSAAIVSDDSGTTAVETDDGEKKPVKVMAAWGGTSVVEGIDEGTVVRVRQE